MSKGPPSDRYHTLKLNNEEVDIIAESLEQHAAGIEEFFRDDALLARRLARFVRKMKYKNNGGQKEGA